MTDDSPWGGALLTLTLEAAVPLHQLTLQQQGGPSDTDYADCRAFAQTLAEKADVLMYRGKKRGQAAELFNKLARALAVLSFCPGGVKFAGLHFRGVLPTTKRKT